MEKTSQSAYEVEASFSKQFRKVADAAYPIDARNDDQNRILIRAFARGQHSDELARKLVEEGNARRGLHHPGWIQCQERRLCSAESA